jgi:carboxylesterase type B
MENTKIILSFNAREFKRAQLAHTDYKNSVQALIVAAKDLGVKLTTKKIQEAHNVYVDVAEQVYNAAFKDSNLPESTNKMKALEMLDISLVSLSQASNKYNALKQYEDTPNQEDFTRYATSQAEIELYNSLSDTVEDLNRLAKANFIKKMKLRKVTKGQ